MTNLKPQLRVLLALRISRDTDASSSVGQQRGRGHTYVDHEGYALVGEAVDEDVSGGIPPAERPDLGKWMKTPTYYDVIWFDTVSRLCRDMFEAVAFFKWAEDNGVVIYIREDNVRTDTWTSEQKLFIIIKAYGAENELKATTSRINLQVKEDRQRGIWLGGRQAFWLIPMPTIVDGKLHKKLQHNTVWTPLMLEIIERVEAGEPRRQIAMDLNKRGIGTPQELREMVDPTKVKKRGPNDPPRKGWNSLTIEQVCSNYHLIGQHVVTKRASRNGGKILSSTLLRDEKTGKPLQVCEPLITEERFMKLQDTLKMGKTKRTYWNRRPFQKIAFCVCGAPRDTAAGRNVVYLRCRTIGAPVVRTCTQRHATFDNVCAVLDEAIRADLGGLPLCRRVDPVRVNPDTIRAKEAEYLGLEKLVRATVEADRQDRYIKEMQQVEQEIINLKELAKRTTPQWEPTGKLFGQVWDAADWGKRGDLLREYEITFTIESTDGPGSEIVHVIYPKNVHDMIRTSGIDAIPSTPRDTTRDQELRAHYGRDVE